MNAEQSWFEMAQLRARRVADAVWIPLRAAMRTAQGEYGKLGYVEEFFGSGSVAIPLDKRAEGDKLRWSDIGLAHDHGSYAFKANYKTADVYQYRDGVDLGLELVMVQSIYQEDPIWHLNQDLVFALKLVREGDVWVCPDDGYVEVIRMRRRENGRPSSLEIKSEYLRDYLAARNMALRVSSYRERVAILEHAPHIKWPSGRISEQGEDYRFEGFITPIHEGGMPYGGETAFFHVWRTDVDPDADVPVLGPPTGGNVDSASRVFKRKGRRLERVAGELWIDEWLEPAKTSPRVRNDPVSKTCSFVFSASGERATADELDNEDIGRWLWFSPHVMPALLERRGFSLIWHSVETGTLKSVPGYSVHFGVNERDLLTVYAFDIARLPDWQQRIWQGFNVSPEGGISSELFSAQVRSIPPHTSAPEVLFKEGLDVLNVAFHAHTKELLFKPHKDTTEILGRVTRFRAINRSGLLGLAKDLARLTVDSINVGALHRVAPPTGDQKLRSLKSLERFLASFQGEVIARQAVSPLAGVYELRLGDAHLPAHDIEEAFELAGVNATSTPLQQGVQLLNAAAKCLVEIAELLSASRLSGIEAATTADTANFSSTSAAAVQKPGKIASDVE